MPGSGTVLSVPNLQEWFRTTVSDAMQRQRLSADPHTEHYIVGVLTGFARSESLYAGAEGRTGTRPLALMLADALDADSHLEREWELRRLGDISLFIAGFFSDSLSRHAVDVDYYVSMGGAAYGVLSDSPARAVQSIALAEVFRELAGNFVAFVDVLSEVAQSSRIFTEQDILRLYEVWVRTGSNRAARKLRELGIEPVQGARCKLTH